MKNQKFNKGELVIIQTPENDFFPLPELGKVACSEEEKHKHLSQFEVFKNKIVRDYLVLVEAPAEMIKKNNIEYLKDVVDLLENHREEELQPSFFIYERRVIVPISKHFLIKLGNISSSHRARLSQIWNKICKGEEWATSKYLNQF